MTRVRLPYDEKMARKAGWGAFVGTTVEWYDFGIYGAASALVFAPLFFSDAPPEIGVLLSFATFWAGFLARPLGGIIFGHLGDRIGRKNALISTLMMMGISTVGIGLLPTYEQIGMTAPAVLTMLRIVQGIAVGGEWGGAVLIATEHAKKDRGFLFGAFAQQGSPAGRILSTLAFMAVTALPDEQLLNWGWRVPFLASAILVAVGLAVRLSVDESPAVVALRESKQTARVPLMALLRGNTRTVLIGIAAIIFLFVMAYARDTFALSWATRDLGFEKQEFLTIILIASVVQFMVQPVGAVMATRWKVRTVVTLLLVLEIPAMPAMFILIGTGNWMLAMIGVAVATIPDVMYYAIMAGMLAQAFPASVRYTGMSATYGIAGALGGATSMIMQALLTISGSVVGPVAFSVLTCLLSLFAARSLLAISAPTQAETAECPPTVDNAAK